MLKRKFKNIVFLSFDRVFERSLATFKPKFECGTGALGLNPFHGELSCGGRRRWLVRFEYSGATLATGVFS